jgi:RNA polymerase primary sigma factor
MRGSDIIPEEAIDSRKKTETFTVSEMDIFSQLEPAPEYEFGDFIDYPDGIGLKTVYDQKNQIEDNDLIEEEKLDECEQAEDLVQSYFHSMGNIAILTRNGEIVLARKIEKVREFLLRSMTRMPLYKKIAATYNNTQDIISHSCEDRSDELLNRRSEILDNLINRLSAADEKIERYGTLQNLRKLIRGKDISILSSLIFL